MPSGGSDWRSLVGVESLVPGCAQVRAVPEVAGVERTHRRAPAGGEILGADRGDLLPEMVVAGCRIGHAHVPFAADLADDPVLGGWPIPPHGHPLAGTQPRAAGGARGRSEANGGGRTTRSRPPARRLVGVAC